MKNKMANEVIKMIGLAELLKSKLSLFKNILNVS